MAANDILIAIADAVRHELTLGQFSQEFIPQRSYRPRFKLEDMDILHVTIVAQSVETKPITRSSKQHDCKIDIGIQQRLEKEDNETIDALMELVNEISDFLTGRKLSQAPAANFIEIDRDPIYSPQHLDQNKQFTSVLTLTYKRVV